MTARTFAFIVDGAQIGDRRLLLAHVQVNTRVRLLRETGNPFHPNAVLVALESGKVAGYLPRSHAKDAATALDEGFSCEATIIDVLPARAGNIPVVKVSFSRPPGYPVTNETRAFSEDLRQSAAPLPASLPAVRAREQVMPNAEVPTHALGCLVLLVMALIAIVTGLTIGAGGNKGPLKDTSRRVTPGIYRTEAPTTKPLRLKLA